MKDSGIQWIGKIPKNWQISKLKYLFGYGDEGLKIGPFGSAMKGKTLENVPYKIYNQAHLIQNDFSINRHFVSEETYKELFNYVVNPGDILFSMMGTIGKCQIMPEGYPEGIMDSHLLKAKLQPERIDSQFFRYAYDKDFSNQVINQLMYNSNGTIMNGLNSSILKNVCIALPPLSEQKEIVDYLDSKVEKIDSRIIDLSNLIDKLQKYKKSLIYEVVTGKKEV
jgi:type I restriction enzyme S subunit